MNLRKFRASSLGSPGALLLATSLCACSAGGEGSTQTGGPAAAPTTIAVPTATATAPEPPPPLIDAPMSRTDGGTTANVCTVNTNPDEFSLPVCEIKAGAQSFDPVVKWSWDGGDGYGPPLVANMTDDNGDGKVDLCDTPDVLIVAGSDTVPFFGQNVPVVHLHLLDGATGKHLLQSDKAIMPHSTPAIGDVDHDGQIDVVAVTLDMKAGTGALTIFNRDLTVKSEKPLDLFNVADLVGSVGMSLADIDSDGKVDLINGNAVWDTNGVQRWSSGLLGILFGGLSLNTISADLDGDGKQEVITGAIAVRPDATILFDVSAQLQGFLNLADKIGFYPAVANLDDDPEPEIVAAGGSGIFVLENDGTVKYKYNSVGHGFDLGDFSPPTIHDFDGDGKPDIGVGSRKGFTVFKRDLTVLWSHPFAGDAGVTGALTGATAFDFLGDGIAEAIYSDPENLLVFDGRTGDVVMSVPRVGDMDYPVVADVDNDGHADIVFASKAGPGLHTVQVISDKQNLWIPTRRIWNQRQYHVTNVLEDGTIPTHETNSWARVNTYRTNVQLEASGVCAPPPPTLK